MAAGWVGWLLRLFRRREEIAEVAEEVVALGRDVFDPADPGQPRSHQTNQHIANQIDSATSHKVQQAPGPSVAKAVDRDAVTPPRPTILQPPPRRKQKDPPT